MDSSSTPTSTAGNSNENNDNDNDNDNAKPISENTGEENKGPKDSTKDADDGDCAICYDVLNKPITLPCKHRFCSSCLTRWRSKFTIDNTKTCPICRSKIPVTKEMISKLNMYGNMVQFLKNTLEKGRPYPKPPQPFYGTIREDDARRFELLPAELQQNILKKKLEQQVQIYTAIIKKSAHEIGVDRTNLNQDIEVLDENNELACDELPEALSNAALTGNIEAVFDWLGVARDLKWKHRKRDEESIIPHKKINATNNYTKASRTLLHEAAYNCNLHLMRFLLQYGATVDPVDAMQVTPLSDACSMIGNNKQHERAQIQFPHASVALLLLEWGSNKNIRVHQNGKSPLELCEEEHHKQLVNLLGSKLGGRRCMIVGLKSRSDLNDKICVVVKYFKKTGRYDVRVSEHPNMLIRGSSGNRNENDDVIKEDECINVKSSNLIRRDRTPIDPGVVAIFDGRTPKTNNSIWKLAQVNMVMHRVARGSNATTDNRTAAPTDR